jgi:hypothetical protein
VATDLTNPTFPVIATMELHEMKKKTVITTEKLEVWIIPQPSELPAGVGQPPSPETGDYKTTNESLVATPAEQVEEEK